MFNSINTKKSKISHKITFIRGDHPEYGELTQYVYAKSEDAAVDHLICCYGIGTKIVKII